MKGQLTKRDIDLIEHCEKNLPISSDMAAILFYPNRYIAQRRLTTIYNLKQLKRTNRLVVNQPYIYYNQKKDLKNLPFTKLLCDLMLNNYDIQDYQWNGDHLTTIIAKEETKFKIYATHQNISQVYKRLELTKPILNAKNG